VVNDQYDVYGYEAPGTDKLMIFVCDPATPQIAVFAALWSDGDFSLRAEQRMAAEAASALGLISPQIFVF
jgi:hypothetical protein